MGKSNVYMKRWLSDKRRFADLLNGSLYQGEQVFTAENMAVEDGEQGLVLKKADGKEITVQRYRDIMMRMDDGTRIVVLACENQGEIHYAMPVREMLYDALSYADQINELRKSHREKKDMKVPAEFLSGMKRTDFLSPVLNIVFYYGEEEWDGSTDLHGLLGLDRKEYKLLTKYVPNYRINLIDPKKLENLECFQTDLQMIFGMLKCRKNKEELKRYVQNNRAYFVQVDQDSYNAVCVMLGSTQHLKTVKTEEGGNVNMCKALEDLYQDGVEEGIEKGLEEGLEKGIKVLVQDYIEEGYSKEIIMDKLIRGFSLNRAESSRYYERFAKPAR